MGHRAINLFHQRNVHVNVGTQIKNEINSVNNMEEYSMIVGVIYYGH